MKKGCSATAREQPFRFDSSRWACGILRSGTRRGLEVVERSEVAGRRNFSFGRDRKRSHPLRGAVVPGKIRLVDAAPWMRSRGELNRNVRLGCYGEGMLRALRKLQAKIEIAPSGRVRLTRKHSFPGPDPPRCRCGGARARACAPVGHTDAQPRLRGDAHSWGAQRRHDESGGVRGQR